MVLLGLVRMLSIVNKVRAVGVLECYHGKLFLTGIDIRFDNVIVFIDLSNCLPLIDAAIIGKVN